MSVKTAKNNLGIKSHSRIIPGAVVGHSTVLERLSVSNPGGSEGGKTRTETGTERPQDTARRSAQENPRRSLDMVASADQGERLGQGLTASAIEALTTIAHAQLAVVAAAKEEHRCLQPLLHAQKTSKGFPPTPRLWSKWQAACLETEAAVEALLALEAQE